MQKIKFILLGFLLVGWWIPQTIVSKTVTLVSPDGETTEIEVDAADKFLEILERIQSYFQAYILTTEETRQGERVELIEGISFFNESPQLNFSTSHAGIVVRAKKTAGKRDYQNSVTKAEKKDISYIVNTLAYDSLISIGTSRSSLKKAGERIKHVHPLRFLMCVFTDEKLKCGIVAIRDRGGWIWDGFASGLHESLNEEFANQNLLQYVPDFAQKVNIDSGLILPSLQQCKWDDFTNILIDKIPRETDPNRYDM